MKFDANDFERAYQIMFAADYSGFTPAVAEAPHGDGRVDAQKRYSHLNYKRARGEALELNALFLGCMGLAREASESLLITAPFAPSYDDSTLRLLEYPAGAGGEWHTDFDLFTINLYRSHPGLIAPRMEVHIGELAEIITGGRLPATEHKVEAHPTQTQRSAVFFVMPPLGAALPTGQVVGDWVAERKARSRVTRGY